MNNTGNQFDLCEIMERLSAIEGKVGFYYENLGSGESLSLNANEPMLAASTIKVPIMAAAYSFAEEGAIDLCELYKLKNEDKLPSCGCLNYISEGYEFKLEDLITLMIILSDNTATNIIIKRLGLENINKRLRELGLSVTHLERLLFDSEAGKRGLENRVSAYELSMLLKRMYKGELVSPSASAKMLEILKNQRLNNKMPANFTENIEIAHKTGEDSGISNDFGIVFDKSNKNSFVICFLGNEIYPPIFNRIIADTTYDIYKLLSTK